MNRFANVLPLMHFLQIVLDIDTFNPKSYPGIDAFIAQSYMRRHVCCKQFLQKICKCFAAEAFSANSFRY